MFHVGQKVVRIPGRDPSPKWDLRLRYSFPEVGEVCTIATLNVWPTKTILTFVEHNNSHLIEQLGHVYEPGFDSKFFRPIVERKTDISVFKAMLNKAPAKQREDVA